MTETNLDKCNRCGLCKNVCPAYQVIKNEIVSPRAKNVLAKDFLDNKTQIDGKYFFEYCTGCKACKEACPIDLGFEVRSVRTKLLEVGYKNSENQEMLDNIEKYRNPFGDLGQSEDLPDKLYCC